MIGAVRVLLCDDVPEFRSLLRAVLEEEPGIAVVGEAGDGCAVVAQTAARQPDVVLLDLAMPVADGLEALPRLRALVPEGRIIVVSGLAAERMAQPCLEAGADEYFEKGSSFARLRETVAGAAA